MDVTGIVVLIGTLAVFLILGLGFLIFHLKNKNVWNWPEGSRITGTYSNFTAHLVYDPELVFKYPPSEVAQRAALAAQALLEETPDAEKNYVAREFLVHVVADAKFNEMYKPTANGILREISVKSGKRQMPNLACRYSTFGSTPETGGLVIHELTHNIIRKNNPSLLGDHKHSDEKYWYPTGIEAKAFERFVKYVNLGVLNK